MSEYIKDQAMRLCKVCVQFKVRVQDGHYNRKDKRWMDEQKRLWNGNTCPSCNLERAKKTMKKTRIKKHIEESIDNKVLND